MAENLPTVRPDTPSIEASTEEWSAYLRSQVDVIRATVAKGATNAQLHFFLHLASHYRLDPFRGEIFWSEKIHRPITSRDGYESIAKRDPDFIGQDAFVVYELDDFEVTIDDGIPSVHHVPNLLERSGNPVGAYSLTHTKGREHPIFIWAAWEHANQNTQVWKSHPDLMMLKCAESPGFKRGANIHGITTAEEIGEQVVVVDADMVPPAPERQGLPPADDVPLDPEPVDVGDPPETDGIPVAGTPDEPPAPAEAPTEPVKPETAVDALGDGKEPHADADDEQLRSRIHAREDLLINAKWSNWHVQDRRTNARKKYAGDVDLSKCDAVGLQTYLTRLDDAVDEQEKGGKATRAETPKPKPPETAPAPEPETTEPTPEPDGPPPDDTENWSQLLQYAKSRENGLKEKLPDSQWSNHEYVVKMRREHAGTDNLADTDVDALRRYNSFLKEVIAMHRQETPPDPEPSAEEAPGDDDIEDGPGDHDASESPPEDALGDNFPKELNRRYTDHIMGILEDVDDTERITLCAAWLAKLVSTNPRKVTMVMTGLGKRMTLERFKSIRKEAPYHFCVFATAAYADAESEEHHGLMDMAEAMVRTLKTQEKKTAKEEAES